MAEKNAVAEVRLKYEEWNALRSILKAGDTGVSVHLHVYNSQKLEGLGLIEKREVPPEIDPEADKKARSLIVEARKILARRDAHRSRAVVEEASEVLYRAGRQCPKPKELRYFLTAKGSWLAKQDITVLPPGRSK